MKLNRKGTIIELQQGSQEWLDYRRGKITGTSAHAIYLDGKGAQTVIDRLVMEMLASDDEEHFKSAAMQRGNDLEPLARMEFIVRNDFIHVEEVGMVQHEKMDKFLTSPDGLVDGYAGLEIKCFGNKNHYEHLKLYKEDPVGFTFTNKSYIGQCQANMATTGNDHWYGVLYNPNFADSGNDYIEFIIERDDDYIAQLEENVEKALYTAEKRYKEMCK